MNRQNTPAATATSPTPQLTTPKIPLTTITTLYFTYSNRIQRKYSILLNGLQSFSNLTLEPE